MPFDAEARPASPRPHASPDMTSFVLRRGRPMAKSFRIQREAAVRRGCRVGDEGKAGRRCFGVRWAWADQSSGWVGNRFEGEPFPIQTVAGDRDHQVVVVADGNPATAGRGEGEKRLWAPSNVMDCCVGSAPSTSPRLRRWWAASQSVIAACDLPSHDICGCRLPAQISRVSRACRSSWES